uniref:Ovule protein n=1 Tax=Brugia timori TaxID=42155 RepID=A0A158PSW1_9BILA
LLYSSVYKVLIFAISLIFFFLFGKISHKIRHQLYIQSLTTQEKKYRECSLMERSNENVQGSTSKQQKIVQVSLHEPAYLHCTIPHLKQNI